jgi:hypothetical protein
MSVPFCVCTGWSQSFSASSLQYGLGSSFNRSLNWAILLWRKYQSHGMSEHASDAVRFATAWDGSWTNMHPAARWRSGTCAPSLREYLSNTFSERWIGRGSDMAWPLRNPDLTTCDNWLWYILKEKISSTAANRSSRSKNSHQGLLLWYSAIIMEENVWQNMETDQCAENWGQPAVMSLQRDSVATLHVCGELRATSCNVTAKRLWLPCMCVCMSVSCVHVHWSPMLLVILSPVCLWMCVHPVFFSRSTP